MKNELIIPAVAWILLTILCIAIILNGLMKVLKKTGWALKKQNIVFKTISAIIVIWVILLLSLSYKGVFADFSNIPPGPALVLLLPLPFILVFTFSKEGTQLLQLTPPQWIIYMQTFRIAVEFLLLMAFLKNRLPVQMTFEGRNFDILTGIAAIPVGYFVAKKRAYTKRLILLFNIGGVLLLVNILVIAVLSMPTPIRYFMNEPANTLVGEFPFILLPGVLVPIAYSMHMLSLRQVIKFAKS